MPHRQKQFIPEWSYLRNLRKQHKTYKEKKVNYYDESHQVRERPDMDAGSEVWVTNSDDKGEPIRGHTNGDS